MSDEDGESYYDREPQRHTDDTKIFWREGDLKTENIVADQICKEWHVIAQSYGMITPIDWWFGREARFLGVLAITSSSLYSTTRYGLLNIRKYRRLVDSAFAHDCLAFYVCKFADRVMHIDARVIDARRVMICHNRRARGLNDREPCIQVLTNHMRPLRGSHYQDAW